MFSIISSLERIENHLNITQNVVSQPSYRGSVVDFWKENMIYHVAFIGRRSKTYDWVPEGIFKIKIQKVMKVPFGERGFFTAEEDKKYYANLECVPVDGTWKDGSSETMELNGNWQIVPVDMTYVNCER